jgi:hypothetical protein
MQTWLLASKNRLGDNIEHYIRIMPFQVEKCAQDPRTAAKVTFAASSVPSPCDHLAEPKLPSLYYVQLCGRNRPGHPLLRSCGHGEE